MSKADKTKTRSGQPNATSRTGPTAGRSTGADNDELLPVAPVAPPRATMIRLLRRPEVLPAAGPTVSYHGGPLIRNVEVFGLYWGAAWNTDPGLSALSATLNAFLTTFVSGENMDVLAQYSVPAYQIGGGVFNTPGLIIDDGEPPNPVTDAQIQAALARWIVDYGLDVNENSLAMIFLPPGKTVIAPWGAASCSGGWCGYHSNTPANVYYAVLPYPCLGTCTGPLGVVDALTATSSHEICEAVTDPVYRTGWWDPHHNEIGDVCSWQVKSVGGYTVQREWSNADNRCV